jgi:hypothetical protein
MGPSRSYTAVLTCHPETYSHAVRSLVVTVGSTTETLALTYALNGDIRRLRIPPARPQRRTNRLWEHTCFEVFISAKGSSAYQEFNFSPSGEWAAFAFHSYRDGAALEDDDLAPSMTVRIGENSLSLDANIDLDRLPTLWRSAVLRLAVAAVIEEEAGMFSYWALKHPPGKPDFHRPDSFVLEVEPPDIAGKQSAVDKR